MSREPPLDDSAEIERDILAAIDRGDDMDDDAVEAFVSPEALRRRRERQAREDDL